MVLDGGVKDSTELTETRFLVCVFARAGGGGESLVFTRTEATVSIDCDLLTPGSGGLLNGSELEVEDAQC